MTPLKKEQLQLALNVINSNSSVISWPYCIDFYGSTVSAMLYFWRKASKALSE